MDFNALRQLDIISSGRIETLDDAATYVRKAAALCGMADSAAVPDDFESRLAAAELDAAKDPGKLVLDNQVAEAFNFMSHEFGVTHPARLTAPDILQYRGVMASIFPHIFSPKSVSGSRPIGAIVMLYMLVYNGGITEGVRKAAQLDRAPGSMKLPPGRTMGGVWAPDRNPNLISSREYQMASLTYLARGSRQEIGLFVERLMTILVKPSVKQ